MEFMDFPGSSGVWLFTLALACAATVGHGNVQKSGNVVDRSIYRSNSGVVFEYVGDVSPSVRAWYHSFVVTIPKIEDLASAQLVNNLRRNDNRATETVLKRYVMGKISELHTHILDSLPHMQTPRRRTRRGKRTAPLGFIGSLSKSLFGKATYDDVVKVAGKVNRLIKFGSELRSDLVSHEETMESYMKVNNGRINSIVAIINSTVHDVEHLEDLLRRHRSALSLNVAAERKYTDSMVQLAADTANAMNYVEDLIAAVNDLSVGTLPRRLDTERMLAEVISHLTDKYADNPSINVLHREPNYYYSHGSVLSHVVGDRDIWITLKIPMGPKVNYNLFKVKTFPVPVGEHTTSIEDLPDYVMVSKDAQTFQGLRYSDLDGCDGRFIRYCPFPTELRVVRDDVSCVSALLQNSYKMVNRQCKIYVSKAANQPMLKHLTTFRFLVSNFVTINVQCHPATTETVQDGCKFCLLDVPCNCRIRAGSFVFLSPISSKCPKASGDQSVTRIHLSNQHVLTELFATGDILVQFPDNGFTKDQTEAVDRKLGTQLKSFLAQDTSDKIELRHLQERARRQREDVAKLETQELAMKTGVSVSVLLGLATVVNLILAVKLFFHYRYLISKVGHLDRSVDPVLWNVVVASRNDSQTHNSSLAPSLPS